MSGHNQRFDAAPVIVTDKRALRKALAKKRPKKLKRPPQSAPPPEVMALYLRLLLARFREVVEKSVKSKVVPLLRRARTDSERIHVLRLDSSLTDQLGTLIDGIRFAWGDIRAITRIAEQVAHLVDEKTGTVFTKSIKTVLGIQPELSEPWLEKYLARWIKDNVSLIVTIPEDYFDSIEHSVRQGFAAGLRHEDIADEIEQDYLANGESAGVAKRRAALVARDQVATLSADLNQKRQTDLGVKRYTWRSSHDQRVRETHRERDGQVFDWSPIEPQLERLGMAVDKIDGHPGRPINCRCYAEPVLADLLED